MSAQIFRCDQFRRGYLGAPLLGYLGVPCVDAAIQRCTFSVRMFRDALQVFEAPPRRREYLGNAIPESFPFGESISVVSPFQNIRKRLPIEVDIQGCALKIFRGGHRELQTPGCSAPRLVECGVNGAAISYEMGRLPVITSRVYAPKNATPFMRCRTNGCGPGDGTADAAPAADVWRKLTEISRCELVTKKRLYRCRPVLDRISDFGCLFDQYPHIQPNVHITDLKETPKKCPLNKNSVI